MPDGLPKTLQQHLEELIVFIWNMEPRTSDAQYLAGKVDGYMDAIRIMTGENNSSITDRLRQQK